MSSAFRDRHKDTRASPTRTVQIPIRGLRPPSSRRSEGFDGGHGGVGGVVFPDPQAREGAAGGPVEQYIAIDGIADPAADGCKPVLSQSLIEVRVEWRRRRRRTRHVGPRSVAFDAEHPLIDLV